MKKIILLLIFIIQCHTLYADVVSNTTYMWPGENASIFWNCGILSDDYNGTFICQGECSLINNTNSSFINITLEPGAAESGVDGNCEFDVRCNSQTQVNQSTCSIEKELEPGRTYTNKDGPCDVSFVCEEYDEPDCEDVFEQVKVQYEYKLEVIDGELTIELFQANKTYFTKTWDIETLPKKSYLDNDDITAICPYYDSRKKDIYNISEDGKIISSYFSGFDSCFSSIESVTSSLNNANDGLIDAESQILVLQNDREQIKTELSIIKQNCETEKNNLNIDINNGNLEIENQRDRTEEMQESKTFWKIWALITSFMVVVQFLLIIFFGFISIRMKGRKQ